MTGGAHRIRRLSWRIHGPSAEEAFTLRRDARRALDDVLLPALEEAFAELAPDGVVVRIPRLELGLRLDPDDDLGAAVARLVRPQLRDRLGGLVGDGISGWEGGDVERVAVGADRLGTLLGYLRSGALAWEVAGGPPTETAAGLRDTARIELARVVEALRSEAAPEAFCFRLLHLLGEDAPALVEALSGRLPSGWSEAVLRVLAGQSPDPATAPAVLRTHLASALLAGGLRAPPAATWPETARVAAARLSPHDRRAAEALIAAVAAPGDERPDDGGNGAPPTPRGERAPSRRTAVTRAAPRAGVPPGSGTEPATRGTDASTGLPVPDVDLPHPAEPGSPAADVPRTDRAAEEPFPIRVENAGLILLHPFLTPLFQRTGIGDEDGIPTHHRPRAAALLHYAARGGFDVYEFELGLIKVLLGGTPEDPLPVADGLVSDRDAEEVDALLRSVIAHWTVLRNTSPRGLRESFLQRPGLLHREDPGWVLRVEPAAFDMLLDHLPWSLSIVKLPWMPEPVQTEWDAR